MYPEDVGEYTVVLRNLGGESRSSCRVDLDVARGNTPAHLKGSGMPGAPKLVVVGLGILGGFGEGGACVG